MIQRKFIIGDQWLYLKLYCGFSTSDKVLTELLEPISNDLYKSNLITSWFFIRYKDPDYHLRWRLFIPDITYYGEIINEINHRLKNNNLFNYIYKIQIDTYNRELERYHGSIEYSEKLFWHESQMLVSIIKYSQSTKDENALWIFSVLAIDQLLNDFNFSITDKYDTFLDLANRFEIEFNANAFLFKQLNKKFNEERENIVALMNHENTSSNQLNFFRKIIEEKSNATKPFIIELVNSESNNKIKFQNLIKSYIHMLMNRLFRSDQRVHEMVIYGFLKKYYRIRIAKKAL